MKVRAAQHQQARAAAHAAQVPRQRLGPEPDLPPHLRGGVRPARRRAVRPAGRRLRLRSPPGRRGAAVRHRHDRRRGARAVHRRGRAPRCCRWTSWAEIANPRDLTRIFTTPEYVAWRALREQEDTRYIGLCMPRFLARLPYGARTDPLDAFAFEEDTRRRRRLEAALGQPGLRLRRQRRPRVRALRLVQPHPRHRPRRRGRGPAGAAPPDRGRRRGPPHRHRDLPQRTARGGTVQLRPDPAGAPQEQRCRRLHQRAIAAKAASLRRPGRHRQRQSLGPAALSVRLLPLRALPEVHGARQGRLEHVARAAHDLAVATGSSATSTARPATSSEEFKAAHPLAAARVVLEDKPDTPGRIRSQVFHHAALPARGRRAWRSASSPTLPPL